MWRSLTPPRAQLACWPHTGCKALYPARRHRNSRPIAVGLKRAGLRQLEQHGQDTLGLEMLERGRA